MKVTQIATTLGQSCGIAVFAQNLGHRLSRAGLDVETVSALAPPLDAEIALVHHHSDLMRDGEMIDFCRQSSCAVVLFAHDEGIDALSAVVDGIMAMCPGIVSPTQTPLHIFPHPAWTPPHLEQRALLRREFGLLEAPLILGSNGFLKFERQFDHIVAAVLPEAAEHGWFVNLMTSPWRLPSPGLLAKLEQLQRSFPSHFRLDHGFLETRTLNRRLQACDLLWCWTQAPSSPYASGVISDQYAAGTRIFAADKLQHGHILPLPNVVTGSGDLDPFIAELVSQMQVASRSRHDPTPVSWDACIDGCARFLAEVSNGRTKARS